MGLKPRFPRIPLNELQAKWLGGDFIQKARNLGLLYIAVCEICRLSWNLGWIDIFVGLTGAHALLKELHFETLSLAEEREAIDLELVLEWLVAQKDAHKAPVSHEFQLILPIFQMPLAAHSYPPNFA